MNEDDQEEGNKKQVIEFQHAYLTTLSNDLKVIEKTINEQEIELDRILDRYLSYKKKLNLSYFLRDKLQFRINEESQCLIKYKEE